MEKIESLKSVEDDDDEQCTKTCMPVSFKPSVKYMLNLLNPTKFGGGKKNLFRL